VRYEYKYTIANFKLSTLRSMLYPFVERDPESIRTGGEYTVRSIYFDTYDFEMYHTKREHLAHRMKVRLRGYNYGDDDSTVFLEIKRKFEGPIVKSRYPAPYGLVKRMFAGANLNDLFPQTERLDQARRFFYQLHARNLRPVTNVIYEREPLMPRIPDPANDCRITIDRDWRCTAYPEVDELFSDRNLAYALPGQFVVEVKFNNYCPVWMKPILAEMDVQKAPASKYVTCVDAHPDIIPYATGRHRAASAFFRRNISEWSD
jgi:hypothetical protein